jgi:uncharacterized membrane protein
MIHDALAWLFGWVCHQQLGAVVCSRCLGIYAGLAISLIVCFSFCRRIEMTKLSLVIHALLIVAAGMAFLKLLPVETVAGRLLSGQIFAIGIGYFLWLGVRSQTPPEGAAPSAPRSRPRETGDDRASPSGRFSQRELGYWVAQLGGVIALQWIAHWPSRTAGMLTDGLTLAGFVLLWVAGGRLLIALARRNAPLPTSASQPPAPTSR